MRRRAAVKPLAIDRLPADKPTRREWIALGRYRQQVCHAQAIGFDPLELRAGMRVAALINRPAYAESNPLYHEVLTRHPELDDSKPGPAWLRLVYRGRHQQAVALVTTQQPAMPAASVGRITQRAPETAPQLDLFA